MTFVTMSLGSIFHLNFLMTFPCLQVRINCRVRSSRNFVSWLTARKRHFCDKKYSSLTIRDKTASIFECIIKKSKLLILQCLLLLLLCFVLTWPPALVRWCDECKWLQLHLSRHLIKSSTKVASCKRSLILPMAPTPALAHTSGMFGAELFWFRTRKGEARDVFFGEQDQVCIPATCISFT